jgi:hypothetical protein
MAYDEEQASRRRVVVETPTEKREVVSSQAVRTPDRSGISAGMVGVLVVVAIALITMLVLFWMSNQQTREENANLAAQQQAQQPPTVIQQPAPAQQPPVIVQQPAAPTTQPAPIIVNPPAGGSTANSGNNDLAVQSAVDKMLTDDPTYSTLGITASVASGKVTLLGIVKSESMKAQIEKSVRKVKGVKDVDNQITVMAD